MQKSLTLFLASSFLVIALSIAQTPPENMQLVLLIGQSNMAGRGIVEPQDQVINPNIFMLTKDLQWVAAKDPVHFDRPHMVFIKLWAAH